VTVLEEDFSTIAATPLLRADYSGDFGGTGGGSGTTHDYVPYELDANASDLDTAILALSPFAYYPLDDASGNPQDVSGNGNHAVSVTATVAYQQAALSTKGGLSFGISDGVLIVPPPRAHLTNQAEDWSLAALFQIVSLAGGHNGAGPAGIYALFGQDAAGNGAWLMMWDDGSGFGSGEAIDGLVDFVTNDVWPHSCIVGPVVVGQTVALVVRAAGPRIEYWVNGVMVGSSIRRDGAITADLAIGGSAEGGRFWDTAQTRWSNLATWQRALTYAEIKTATEAMADAAIFAAAFTP
jgi:hypothetical protein